MKNQSIDNPLKLLVKLVSRYNFVIFIVIVSVSLMVSILVLNGILDRPYTNNSSPNTSSTIFDTSTINRLNKLETSAKNSAYSAQPLGRVNPFSE